MTTYVFGKKGIVHVLFSIRGFKMIYSYNRLITWRDFQLVDILDWRIDKKSVEDWLQKRLKQNL